MPIVYDDQLIRRADARRAILRADPSLAYCLDRIPSVAAAPVVHGQWEYVGVSAGKKIYRCTHCKTLISGRGNYCSFCGATMSGKREGDNGTG